MSEKCLHYRKRILFSSIEQNNQTPEFICDLQIDKINIAKYKKENISNIPITCSCANNKLECETYVKDDLTSYYEE